jgi:hypothetical protein
MEDHVIRYDAPAVLEKWPSIEAMRVRTSDYFRSAPIYNGTLAGCVREFMQKPISQRPLYDIFTDRQPGLPGTILRANDIVEIAEREDFPQIGARESNR